MSSIPRILDANVNRAREAMRVMEDAARFALEDEAICAELKQLRHDLRAALAPLPEGWLEANRHTPGDVGARLSTEAEMSRGNLADIVIAAGKRLTEALRVIEEMSKTMNVDLAREIERLRYRAYDVDQKLSLRLGSSRATQWRLCLILTRALCRRPWQHVLQRAINAGAKCVQVREKAMEDVELMQHVRDVLEIARPACVPVIVNDRADVALASGADGVHLGQSDLSVSDVRRIAGRTLIVGASTHDLREAKRAVEDGADYCGVGAMFASSTKQRKPSGPDYLRSFIERYPDVSHLAIGGIDAENIARVIEAGARSVAVSAAICGAEDPGAITHALVAAFDVAAAALPARVGG